MPLFLTRGNYTQSAIAGMMAKPEDRTQAISPILKSVGGTLHAMYNTLGEYDFLIVAEAPSERDMLSVLLVAAGTGSVFNLNTTLAWPASEAVGAFAKASDAGNPVPPGRPAIARGRERFRRWAMFAEHDLVTRQTHFACYKPASRIKSGESGCRSSRCARKPSGSSAKPWHARPLW